jgi:excisionase family DNA binding protein
MNASRVCQPRICQESPAGTATNQSETGGESMLSQYPLALTVTQTAEILGVTPARTRELLRRGLLPGIRLGNLWRIPRSRLEALLSGSEQ